MSNRLRLAQAPNLARLLSARGARLKCASFHSTCQHSYPIDEKAANSRKSFSKNNSKPELLTDERLQQIVSTLEKPVDSESADSLVPGYLKAIENLRPTSKRVISSQRHDKILEALNKSFTVPQLVSYLKHNDQKKGKTKSRLISQVMSFWGLKTQEQIKAEEKLKKKDRAVHSFTASREELFFIIGDNGVTLRGIEQGNGVNITINVANHQCIIEGPSKSVDSAKAAMQAYLNISRELVDFPRLKDNVTYDDVTTASNRLLADISTASGAYVALQDEKFMVAGLSQASVNTAKRLLSQTLTELGITAKQPLSAADHILVQKNPEEISGTPYVLIPLHDAPAMPLAFRTLGWSRATLLRNKPSVYAQWLPKYQILESKGIVSDNLTETDSTHLKDMICRLLNDSTNSEGDISLQGLYGQVLFQNPPLKDSSVNLLRPALRSSFTLDRLATLLTRKIADRQIFFSSNPPNNLTSSFLPLMDGEHFHRRTIRVEYVSDSLLAELGTVAPNQHYNPTLRRLNVDFVEKMDGQLEAEKVTGEHARAVIDLIGVEGIVDVRLLAKRSTMYATENSLTPEGIPLQTIPDNIQGLIEQCQLAGYTDMTCPDHCYGPDGSKMTLFDVSFRSETHYLYMNNLITVSQIEEQDSRTKRTELMITPIAQNEVPENEQQQRRHYLASRNGLDQWNPFMDTLESLAKKWRYRLLE